MQTFAMLTKLQRSGDGKSSLSSLETDVVGRVRATCPGVEWIGSYAVLGPYDYLDLFRAADSEEAMKVATIVRTVGPAETETWPLLDWDRFKTIAGQIAA